MTQPTCDPSILAKKIEQLEKAEAKRRKFWKIFWDVLAIISICVGVYMVFTGGYHDTH